jgi:hypothetical protein
MFLISIFNSHQWRYIINISQNTALRAITYNCTLRGKNQAWVLFHRSAQFDFSKGSYSHLVAKEVLFSSKRKFTIPGGEVLQRVFP